ncbi:uncharacterized protein LOC123318840 [Coccinella septempunctata]|uniref:uncharacterized protein LOC123318840 n=1 Tax=Coccinella septempunctata TaxID=41139 RepID=UPI001D05D85D|nr:uncharacterized protein LOC123318840 [Coccinella septempunctata]
MERGRHAIDTRKLIELVRANPMLYDPTLDEHKDIRMRDERWALIASEMGQHPDDLKKKWKNIRDTYIRYLKAAKTKHGAKPSSLSKWAWSKHMRFFRPYFAHSKRRAAATADASEFDGTAALEPYFDDPLQNLKMEVGDVVLEEQASCYPDADQESSEYEAGVHFNPRRRSPLRLPYGAGLETNMDETELLFVAFAKTVKKFSKRRLAKAKMLVAKVVMEQELINIEEQNALDQSRDPACPPSSSDSISADQRAAVNRQAVKN